MNKTKFTAIFNFAFAMKQFDPISVRGILFFYLSLVSGMVTGISGCKPTLYNSDPSSLENSVSTATDPSSVSTTEVATTASSSPSPSPSASTSSNSPTVVTVTGPSSQTKGICQSYTLTASDSTGTTSAMTSATAISLTGGSTSVFSTSTNCGTQVTSVTLTKLESSLVFYHRSVDSGTISITPSATGFTGTASSVSMSSGSWSTPDYFYTATQGMSAVNYYNTEFWTYFTDPSGLFSMHRSLTGTWSSATTLQSGLDTPGVPLVRSNSDGQMIIYHALGGDAAADAFAMTYSSTSGYSTAQQLDTTSVVSSGKTKIYESNSTGEYIVTWIEGTSGYASVYKKSNGQFDNGIAVVNTGVAPSGVKAVLYDDGTGILFANVSNDLKYSVLSASGWSALTSLGVNGVAFSLSKTSGLSSAIVYVVAGTMYETSHAAGSTTIGTSTAIAGMGAASNTTLASDGDGNLHLLYVNMGATEMAVATKTAAGVWSTPTSILASGGGLISLSALAVDSQGNAFALDDQGGNMIVSRYIRGVGWQTYNAIDSQSNPISYPTITSDPQGHAMISWKQIDDQAVSHYYYSIFQ